MRKKTNKELTTQLQEGTNQLLVPMVRPVIKTRGELVNQRAKELEAGEITAWDFAQELKLTDQQFKYCEVFSDIEHLGNGEQAAMIAFNLDPTDKKVLIKARNIAKKMGTHQGVITLINALLSSQGLNEQNLKKQLNFLINQNADLKMKGIAIKIGLDVLGLLKKDQTISIKHSFDYGALSTDELIKMKQIMNKAAGNITDAEIIE